MFSLIKAEMETLSHVWRGAIAIFYSMVFLIIEYLPHLSYMLFTASFLALIVSAAYIVFLVKLYPPNIKRKKNIKISKDHSISHAIVVFVLVSVILGCFFVVRHLLNNFF